MNTEFKGATFNVYTYSGAMAEITINSVSDQQRYFDWAKNMPGATMIDLIAPDGKTYSWSKPNGVWQSDGWKLTVVTKASPWWLQQ